MTVVPFVVLGSTNRAREGARHTLGFTVVSSPLEVAANRLSTKQGALSACSQAPSGLGDSMPRPASLPLLSPQYSRRIYFAASDAHRYQRHAFVAGPSRCSVSASGVPNHNRAAVSATSVRQCQLGDPNPRCRRRYSANHNLRQQRCRSVTHSEQASAARREVRVGRECHLPVHRAATTTLLRLAAATALLMQALAAVALDEQTAIFSMYRSLGSQWLPDWGSGDPCATAWYVRR